MSVSMYRSEIQRRQQEIARLSRQKADASTRAANENRQSNDALDRARRASSTSSANSYLRDAQRHQESSARYQKDAADIESKIAREQSSLNDAEKRLASELQREAEKATREQQRAARENEERMRRVNQSLMRHDATFNKHAFAINHHDHIIQQHAELHRVAADALKRVQQLPEAITVLFLAADPVSDQPLRLGAEVRSISEMIRKSDHRDAIRLESRWAVRPLDVLQAINECRPRIVHFSGHGTEQDQIVFEDNAGGVKLVSKEAIVQTIAAGASDIELVFFNTCFSGGQAEAIVDHIPCAVGMSDKIGDKAAEVFAAAFYSAIGFGHSVHRAFEQAKAALMLEDVHLDGKPQVTVPELFMTPGLDAKQLILVRSAPSTP
ncbi:MAG: CHAT domain-containing protein [Tepidisphaeraceae bacterium]